MPSSFLLSKMRGQTQLQQHIPQKAILDLAEDMVSLTAADLEHLDRCTESFAQYAKLVHVARQRALEKCKERTIIKRP